MHLLALVISVGLRHSQDASSVSPQVPTIVSIEAFEANYLPLQPKGGSGGDDSAVWTAPTFDGDEIVFSWKVVAAKGHARGITVTDARVILSTATSTNRTVCEWKSKASFQIECTPEWSKQPAAYYNVLLSVEIRIPGQPNLVHATANGSFIRGLDPTAWGDAQWIGLVNPNDTRSQFRAQISMQSLGGFNLDDITRATLFIAGLGGHRATVNGRALDPSSLSASVTEWIHRTHYFTYDITVDFQRARESGAFIIAVELYKHWYGLSNHFYPQEYGPRSLKAVVILGHKNGSSSFILPTCSSRNCLWVHGGKTTKHEDLHTGQEIDARLAVPGWDTANPSKIVQSWSVPSAVKGPKGDLRPHPMPKSRVLEVLFPVSVSRVAPDNQSKGGPVFRYTLPHEVAGFCTHLLPVNTPEGAFITVRNGEAVNEGTGHLIDVECTGSLGPAHGFGCVRLKYTARGNTKGLSAHDKAWRDLASRDKPQDVEAFTPAFQFSAFRFVQVTYHGFNQSFEPPTVASLTCYRIGSSFDWTGDIAVSPASSLRAQAESKATTAASRFNAVVAAARSTAVSNYLMDIPTDCPHREKRGWTGDSLAAHRTLGSLFDLRATWTKWVDDILFTQSLLQPSGTVPSIVPCIFQKGHCQHDPRTPDESKQPNSFTDVAWGSLLPILAEYTARLTGNKKFTSRALQGASKYIKLLNSYANTNDTEFPGLLNASRWPASCFGDWVPAVSGDGRSVSSLLNSYQMILDIDATAELYRMNSMDREAESLTQLGTNARFSFRNAFLRNVSSQQPNHGAMCGSVREGTELHLSCASSVISHVKFASYGLVNGSCSSSFQPAPQCSVNITSAVAAACVGRSSCSIECEPVPHKRLCAGVNVSDPCAGVHKYLSIIIDCSSPQDSPSELGFHDPYPPHNPPQAQTETASGMVAMNSVSTTVINGTVRAKVGKTLADLVLNHNTSNPQRATVTGGVIDMANLAPALMLYGHPDVAFLLLSADGYPSYFRMAKYGGTLFENWKNALGCDLPSGCEDANVEKSGKGVGSLNHIMYSGSVVSAIEGIGGLSETGDTVAPVPWISDAPIGTVVREYPAGITSASWSARRGKGNQWTVWVNASIPIGRQNATIQIMFPQGTTSSTVCLWECGKSMSMVKEEWFGVDIAGGRRILHAQVPSSNTYDAHESSCTRLWPHQSTTATGVSHLNWVNARPGYTKFPFLTATISNGAYSFWARPC